jgi:hypothetical protein
MICFDSTYRKRQGVGDGVQASWKQQHCLLTKCIALRRAENCFGQCNWRIRLPAFARLYQRTAANSKPRPFSQSNRGHAMGMGGIEGSNASPLAVIFINRLQTSTPSP